MMTRRFLFLFSAACILLVGGCKVHEVPEGGDDGAVVELTLNLKFDKDLPLYKEIDYESKGSEAYTGRIVVGLFRYASDKANDKPDYVFVFDEAAGPQDLSEVVRVAPMNYQVLVWADYVSSSTVFYTSPVFYNDLSADKFTVVTLEDPYCGNTPWRDAFYGVQDVKLSSYLENLSKHSIDVQMERPNARYNFVATDKDQFAKYMASKSGDEFDVTDFLVKITYPQFLPCAYDVLKEAPVDSRTGVEFDVTPTLLSDGNIDLGSDWVFANGDKTSVIVTLSFYDANGQFISSLNNLEVPLCRGKNTTIKGALLTSGVSSGISIDPSFDGEYVIEF